MIGRDAVGAGEEAGGRWSRRQLLSVLFLTGGALACGVDPAWPAPPAADDGYGFPGGKRLGTVAFVGEGDPVLDAPFGAELDGRLVTDLTKLPWNATTVPTADFYIRTRASQKIDPRQPWRIRLGDGETAPALDVEDLRRQARPMGLHVIECSGNSKARQFGLLSAADWHGVPLRAIVDRLPRPKDPSLLLVSGFDTYSATSKTSVPGASWLLTPDDVERTGAFLATTMNGAPLPPDHGAPVRLVVPDWYGCSCIKWVNEIRWVPANTPSTSQMLEYAGRTGQDGVPALASNYAPPVMDPAAMPVRVEQWQVDGRLRYLVVGIAWGQAEKIERLDVQFNTGEPFVAVPTLGAAHGQSWRFWACPWSPASAGRYEIRLRVAAPQMRTRRLDVGRYTRAVQIAEV